MYPICKKLLQIPNCNLYLQPYYFKHFKLNVKIQNVFNAAGFEQRVPEQGLTYSPPSPPPSPPPPTFPFPCAMIFLDAGEILFLKNMYLTLEIDTLCMVSGWKKIACWKNTHVEFPSERIYV